MKMVLRYIAAGGLYCVGVLILADLLRTMNYIRNERRAREMARARERVPYKLS
jgi:hypothetical protein